ncbi:uncharacterized protein LOC134248512, partial [Saccostrea cucullata]|uniref:uncharacterized protein LOC134248512 n=1 Tax=Saccostrea cuccullata TaxID=36930 RepID=UPI002ED58B18
MGASNFVGYHQGSKRGPRGLTWFFWFVLIVFGFFLTGFFSDSWLESSISSEYDHRTQGLWRFCYYSLGESCCGYINEVMYIEPFLQATRAFFAISLLPQFICLIAVCKGITTRWYSEYKNMGGYAAGIA